MNGRLAPVLMLALTCGLATGCRSARTWTETGDDRPGVRLAEGTRDEADPEEVVVGDERAVDEADETAALTPTGHEDAAGVAVEEEDGTPAWRRLWPSFGGRSRIPLPRTDLEPASDADADAPLEDLSAF